MWVAVAPVSAVVLTSPPMSSLLKRYKPIYVPEFGICLKYEEQNSTADANVDVHRRCTDDNVIFLYLNVNLRCDDAENEVETIH